MVIEAGRRRSRRVAGLVAWAGLVWMVGAGVGVAGEGSGEGAPLERAVGYLAGAMDRYSHSFDVFNDVNDAGNHFPALAMMPAGAENVWIDVCCTNRPHRGASCIECGMRRGADHWAGFYFLNGVMDGEERYPRQNWGDVEGAGFDLRGTLQVSFYARGAQGGERVEFFVGGVGWSVDYRGRSIAPEAPYPDSFPKVSTGFIRLTDHWQKYTIDLKGYDLSYVIGGFGWVVDMYRNRGHDEVCFYLDDIRWEKERPGELQLPVSYETAPRIEGFDSIMRNASFTYDDALTILAFLALDTEEGRRRAGLLADGLVYAAHHDRCYEDVRLRNAYMAGDLKAFPGWKTCGRAAAARLPNFWDCDKGEVFEDRVAVGTYCGNVAWAMIALVSAYEHLGREAYLETAEELGRWVIANCLDERGAGGFTGGYEGWYNAPEKLTWKSTEHNLDLYVAFRRLAAADGDRRWLGYAAHAKRFIEAMWDPEEGKFWTGTGLDGVEINRSVVPLDVQSWAVLAFRRKINGGRRGLDYAEAHHACDGGFDFNRDCDGVWFEGTAQMAVAYELLGRVADAQRLLKRIEKAQMEGGAIPAASHDGLTTGFKIAVEGNPDWVYFHRGHLGATAWYIFARLGVNPYWL